MTTNTYIKIQSKGEIEEKAFTLLGNSTKRGKEGQIGYFGSGLKYSISALLRNGIPFVVFSGDQELNFTVESEKFRGEDFQVITLNGKQTSFTTKMGGDDWDTPFAPLREIYSNALDEDQDAILDVTELTEPKKGYTTFYILATDAVADFYSQHQKYFCIKNPNVLHANDHGAIYPSNNRELILFRSGIRCTKEIKTTTEFNYNSHLFRINESRVIDNNHQALTVVAWIWKQCTDKSLIIDLLNSLSGGNTGRYEHDLNWEGMLYEGGNIFDAKSCRFSPVWREICEADKFVSVEHLDMFDEKEIIGRRILPFSLLKTLREKCYEGIDILGLKSADDPEAFHKIIDKPIQRLVDKVLDAVSKLNATSYKYRLNKDTKIIYVRFKDTGILGKAENGKILLSENVVDLSVDEVAKIIIEENEHIRTGFDDETRNFQNHLFNIYYEALLNESRKEDTVTS